jgi:hypothetical protein
MANGSREEAQKNYGKIVEDTDKLVHFRLPPKLNKLFSGDLSEGKIKWGGAQHMKALLLIVQVQRANHVVHKGGCTGI